MTRSAEGAWPVERVVNVGEYVEQVDWVELSEAVPHGVHAGKYQVEAETFSFVGATIWVKVWTCHKCW